MFKEGSSSASTDLQGTLRVHCNFLFTNSLFYDSKIDILVFQCKAETSPLELKTFFLQEKYDTLHIPWHFVTPTPQAEVTIKL